VHSSIHVQKMLSLTCVAATHIVRYSTVNVSMSIPSCLSNGSMSTPLSSTFKSRSDGVRSQGVVPDANFCLSSSFRDLKPLDVDVDVPPWGGLIDSLFRHCPQRHSRSLTLHSHLGCVFLRKLTSMSTHLMKLSTTFGR
jgi:hypothetical protein